MKGRYLAVSCIWAFLAACCTEGRYYGGAVYFSLVAIICALYGLGDKQP